MSNNTANLQEILEILKTKGATSSGGENNGPTKYTLSGTYVLAENPSYATPAKTCQLTLPANTVYSFALDLTQNRIVKYASAAIINFSNFFYITYPECNSALNWKNNTWFSSSVLTGSEIIPFPDNRYRIIDFKAPVEVTQEFYNLFMSIVDNSDTTPYEIGYDMALDENPFAEISYDSTYKTLTITTS